MKNKLLFIVIAETVLLVCFVLFSLIQRAKAEEYRTQAIQQRLEAEQQQTIAIHHQQLYQQKQAQLELALQEAQEARTKLKAYLVKHGGESLLVRGFGMED